MHCISDKISTKMSNEIEYFPRGASTTKKESSSDKPRINRVDRNDLFVNSSTAKRKRSRETSQKLKVEQKKKKKKSLDGEDHQNNLYRRLHKQVCFILLKEKKIISFHFKNLTDGVLICGCIEKITPFELRVSLPHQNIGYIPLNMISDEYTELIEQKMSSTSTENFEDLDDLFQLGQFVICRVIESQSNNDNNENGKNQKRLHLSINPKDVSDQLTPDHLVKGMVRQRKERYIRTEI